NRLNGSMRTPYPVKAVVAEEATAAANQMRKLANKLGAMPLDARSLAAAYLKDSKDGWVAALEENWDSAAQLYLALAALSDGKNDQPVDFAVQKLLEKLAFPPGREVDQKYESPRDYQPKLLRGILKPVAP